jgi:hypothetical protein
MRRTLIWSMLVAAVLTSAASAALINENLLVEIPQGYKIDFQDRQPAMLMNEMVPKDQTVGDWTEMVTVQIFYRLKTTPDEFEAKLADGWVKSCPGATTHSVVSGGENGYQTGVWILNCPKNPAKIRAVERRDRAVDEISARDRNLRLPPDRPRLSADQSLAGGVQCAARWLRDCSCGSLHQR